MFRAYIKISVCLERQACQRRGSAGKVIESHNGAEDYLVVNNTVSFSFG